MRSAARGSPWARPRSASTTPTSDRPGKLWPLATSCVPMTMSASPRRDGVQLHAQPLESARHVAGQHQRPRRREAVEHLLLQPLHAGAAGDEALLRAAIWAGGGPPLLVPAMMAGEDAAKAVIHQPGRAVGAGHPVPAGAAERERGIAAAVEEKERLLAVCDGLRNRRGKRRRQPAAALRRVLAHVDGGNLRRRAVGVARGQDEPPVAAAIGVDAAFHRGRGGGEHDRKAGEIGPHHRHVARVIGDPLLLLVGGVVLLVDDDQAEVAETAGTAPSGRPPPRRPRRAPPPARRARAPARRHRNATPQAASRSGRRSGRGRRR